MYAAGVVAFPTMLIFTNNGLIADSMLASAFYYGFSSINEERIAAHATISRRWSSPPTTRLHLASIMLQITLLPALLAYLRRLPVEFLAEER